MTAERCAVHHGADDDLTSKAAPLDAAAPVGLSKIETREATSTRER